VPGGGVAAANCRARRKVIAVAVDVADHKSVDAAFARVRAELGPSRSL